MAGNTRCERAPGEPGNGEKRGTGEPGNGGTGAAGPGRPHALPWRPGPTRGCQGNLMRLRRRKITWRKCVIAPTRAPEAFPPPLPGWCGPCGGAASRFSPVFPVLLVLPGPARAAPLGTMVKPRYKGRSTINPSRASTNPGSCGGRGPGWTGPALTGPGWTGPVLTLCCLRRSRWGRGRKQHAGPSHHPAPQHVPAEGAAVSAGRRRLRAPGFPLGPRRERVSGHRPAAWPLAPVCSAPSSQGSPGSHRSRGRGSGGPWVLWGWGLLAR